jgi:ABC-2 type transport system ATP-binding protein
MPEPVIRVRRLTKRFPVRRRWTQILRAPAKSEWSTALQGVDLDVPQGEVLGLVGANGAGKTTFVKILSTLLLPTDGHAEVMNYDVVKFPMEVRHAVGWCLDTERSFYHRLTGIENLAFFAALNNISSGRAKSRLQEVLEISGLGPAARRPVRTYSRGMQQKLGLARALLTNPAILLLDEPTKSLDPVATREFWRFVRDVLAREMKKTILIVTHDLVEARTCCDRIAFMDAGQISAIGTWADIEPHIQEQGFEEKPGSE